MDQPSELVTFTSLPLIVPAAHCVVDVVSKHLQSKLKMGGFISVGNNEGQIFFSHIVGYLHPNHMRGHQRNAEKQCISLGGVSEHMSSSQFSMKDPHDTAAIRVSEQIFSFDSQLEHNWNEAIVLAVAAKSSTHFITKEFLAQIEKVSKNPRVQQLFDQLGLTIV